MSLWELSPVVLFGWPAIIASLVLCATGIVRVKPKWLVIAAIFITPISLYLAATPRFTWVVLVLPVLFVGAGIAVRRSRFWLAWSLFVPFVGFFGWLAVIVMSE